MTIIIRLAIFLGVLFLVDLYAYQSFRTLFRETPWAKYLYWVVSLAVLTALVVAIFKFDRSKPQPEYFKYFIGIFILFFVPKLVVSFILLAEDVLRIFVGIGGRIAGTASEEFLPDRRKFISTLALGLAAIPFAGIIHGIWKGRYNYRVIKKTLFFDNLPEAFEGTTITQISDIHSGSFDNPEKIQYGIDLINQQQSDYIFFTGDLVNNRADEMAPWVEVFSQLKAPGGKYSILGNHDYGDYVEWPDAQSKQANMEQLYGMHEAIGFRLMRNESLRLEKDGQHIDLLGVENWGEGFHQYGDLDKASAGLDADSFKILLSHDPTHYEKVVLPGNNNIALTLSGHTHGMQFGIEIPGLVKWSPVQFRYPKWAGWYETAGKQLYINRGFGFLAFPGRVGIWPEITVLELRKNKQTA